MHQLLAENGDVTGADIDDEQQLESAELAARAFANVDSQNDGVIDSHEFKDFVVQVLGLRLGAAELEDLWRACDINRSGALNVLEFAARFFPAVEARQVSRPPHCRPPSPSIALHRPPSPSIAPRPQATRRRRATSP